MYTEEEIEKIVSALGSNKTFLDKIVKSMRSDVPAAVLQPAFVCGASGLFFPGDYVENFGSKYGSGLGYVVCSETLQTNYDRDPVMPRNSIDPSDLMHPVYVSRAPVSFIPQPTAALEGRMAIVAKSDQRMWKRREILRIKQGKNPRSRITRFRAEWARINKEGA